NAGERRSLLTKVFRATPVYEPDRFEASQVQPLVAPVPWHSCIVLPIADQDDLIALLLIVSARRNAFAATLVEEVLAMRTVAALHLQDAYSQLAAAQHRLNEQNETMEFLREVFEASQIEYDVSLMSRALVQRFCEAFSVDRCSFMRVDDQHLAIAAHRGMDPLVAGSVKLPLGEGVAGWVAHHRKP